VGGRLQADVAGPPADGLVDQLAGGAEAEGILGAGGPSAVLAFLGAVAAEETDRRAPLPISCRPPGWGQVQQPPQGGLAEEAVRGGHLPVAGVDVAGGGAEAEDDQDRQPQREPGRGQQADDEQPEQTAGEEEGVPGAAGQADGAGVGVGPDAQAQPGQVDEEDGQEFDEEGGGQSTEY
jgi:hypothetical protein